jgi:signal transduction histidine kinase
VPFITAGACGAAFGLMVALEYVGLIPHLNVNLDYYLPLENQLMIVLVVFGLLFVVAFISSYTAGLLKKNRDSLQQQNEELNLAKMAADKANNAKSEFLANMSHELRTPLNHIIGFTEIVLEKNFGELNEMQEEYLNDVHHSSRHLLSLINDILDLSKVEAGKIELEPSNCNLKMVLENSLVMIKEKAMKHRIRLTMDMDGVPETIKADERKLKQIIYNILSNAVKFTPDGGEILLTANRVTRSESRVGAERQSRFIEDPVLVHPTTDNAQDATGEYIEISVADTGIGIRPEDTDRIFNPFEQIDGSLSRKYQGTGLGLSLTKCLIELHGGTIWVESEGEGKGSIFSFIIPV